MRIISGKYKGKKLNQPLDKFTRPLKDMTKESIFNLLEHSKLTKVKIENSIILDLFSGSGSFGLECLSRGASNVTFCENYPQALEILEKNIKYFNCKDKINIIKDNIFDLIKVKNYFKTRFDLIFLDPPFKEEKINELILDIKNLHILDKNGILVLHRNKKDKNIISNNFNVILEKIYGISKIFFIKL
tara:strand:- start:54 stop:617 length:564 start_codon:yes stop_codon:yes gene_type:complete